MIGSSLKDQVVHPVRRTMLIIASLVASLALVLGLTPSVAQAQGSANLLSISTSTTTVQSGGSVTYNVAFSCNNPAGCGGATIRVPIPTAVDDPAVELKVGSAQAAAGGRSSTPVIGDGYITWTLSDNVTVGTSSSVSFVLQTTGSLTPNGTQVIPTATFTLKDGSQAVNATAATPLTITAEPVLGVTKELVNNALGNAIPLDGVARYRLTPYSASFTRNALGQEAVEAVVVTDTLPEGAELETMTLANGTVLSREQAIEQGRYDAATRTVTWPEFDLAGVNATSGKYSMNRLPVYYINVKYPSGNHANGDRVTNVAGISGDSLSGVPVEDTGEASHRLFTGDPSTQPASGKGPGLYNSAGVYNPRKTDFGQSGTFDFSFYNTAVEEQQLVFADTLPCAWTSNDAKEGCDEPYFQSNVTFSFTALQAPATLTWWTKNGQTGSTQLAIGATRSQPNVSAGDVVTRFELRSNLLPGSSLVGSISGDILKEPPATNKADANYESSVAESIAENGIPEDKISPQQVVENCLDDESGFYSLDGSTKTKSVSGSTDGRFGPCGYNVINPIAPKVQIVKTMSLADSTGPTVANTLTNGQEARVWLQIIGTNSPVEAHPVVADLLPEGITYVPGSLEAKTLYGNPTYFEDGQLPDSLMRVEVIDNYNGTNRQLVRVSWPGAPGIEKGKQIYDNYVTFKVKLANSIAGGRKINTGFLFDENITTDSESGEQPPNICDGTQQLDTNNLRGYEKDYGCKSDRTFTVQAVAAMNLEKTVQNITKDDGEVRSSTEWQTNAVNGEVKVEDRPVVGIDAGEVAEYKLLIENDSSIPLTNILAYDILPYKNDYNTILANYPRNSEWTSILANVDGLEALETTYPGLKVQYSTSKNPCRGELLGTNYAATSTGPTGCDNNWTDTPPSNLEDVFALRFDFGSYVLGVGETLEIPIQVMGNSVRGGVAWNSFAAVAKDVPAAGRTQSVVLPTETETVGLVLPSDLAIDKNLIEIDGEAITEESLASKFIGNGTELTWELKVTNQGPGWATVLRVDDELSEFLEYMDISAVDNFGNSVEGMTYDVEAGVIRFPENFQLAPQRGTLSDPDTPNTITFRLGTRIQNAGSHQEICNSAAVFAAEKADTKNSDDQDRDCVTTGVNVSGTVWEDPNEDGSIDDGEKRIPGVTVELVDPSNPDVPLRTTTTNENGFYEFPGVPSGNYTIRISNVPPEYVIDTYDPDGVEETPHETSITVEDEDVTEQNFGVTFSDANAEVEVSAKASVAFKYNWKFEKNLVSSSVSADRHPVSSYEIVPEVIGMERVGDSTYTATITVTNSGERESLKVALGEVSSALAGACTLVEDAESEVVIPAGGKHDFLVECDLSEAELPEGQTDFADDTLSYVLTYPDRADLADYKGTLTDVDIETTLRNQEVRIEDDDATDEVKTYTAGEELEPWEVQWIDETQTVPSGECVTVQNTATASFMDGGEPIDFSAEEVEICNAQVSGHIYIDEDKDGRDLIKEDGTPTYSLYSSSPVTVRLLKEDGTPQAELENVRGTFVFENVPKGNYTVEFVLRDDEPVGIAPHVEEDTSNIEDPNHTDAGSDDPTTRVVRTGTFTVGTNKENSNVENVDIAVFPYGELGSAITVTADGTYHNKYTWNVEKTVDQTRFDVAAGAQVTANYTVSTRPETQFVGEPGVALKATVTLTNDSPAAVEVTGLVATANGYVCDPLTTQTVPANGSVDFEVSCVDEALLDRAPSEEAARSQVDGTKVTVSGTSNRGEVNVVGTLAGEDLTLTYNRNRDETPRVSVYDKFEDEARQFLDLVDARLWSQGDSYEYSKDFVAVAGQCVTYNNTANVEAPGVEGDQLTDSAAVTVCAQGSADPEVSADVTFDRTYGWDLTKELVGQTQDLAAGTAQLNYKVTTTEKAAEDSGYAYSGTVKIANNDDDRVPAWNVKVAATSAKGFECTVSPDSATIAPLSELEFGVSCDVPEGYSGDLEDTLTVTGTREAADGTDEALFTKTAQVTGEDAEYNEQVTVSDPAIGFEATYDWTGEGTTHVENLTWPVTLRPDLEGCQSFNNEAILTGENDQELATDNAVGHVCAATVSGRVFVDTTEGHTGDQLEGAVLFGGEPTLVELLDANDNVVASQETVDGSFKFTRVELGTYKVRFTLKDEQFSWSKQAENDPEKITEQGRTDAGVDELDPSVKVLTTEEFLVSENRSNVPNIDAAVWQIKSLTVDGGDTNTSVKVNGTYGYRYEWGIEKSVDKDSAEVKPGDSHTANYTVKVNSVRSLIVGKPTAEVSIELRNGEIREAQVSLVEVDGFGECTPAVEISEDNPFVVPVNETRTITVNCELEPVTLGVVTNEQQIAERLADLQASVRIEQLHVFEQPALFALQDADPEVAYDAALDENDTAKVTDSLVMPNGDTVDQVLAETLAGADALEGVEFTYSQKLPKTGDQPEDFVNTATVTDEEEEEKTSTTTVTLTSPPDEGGSVIPFVPWFGGKKDNPPASSTPTAAKPEVEQKRSFSQLARTGASVLGVLAAAGLLTAAGAVMIRRKRETE